MAPARIAGSRADAFADLEDQPVYELDPEADDGLGQTSDDSSEASDQLDDGREHYQIVEKSTLRRHKLAPLGPQYWGTRVDRDALDHDDNDDDDGYAIDDDEEDMTDSAVGENKASAGFASDIDDLEADESSADRSVDMDNAHASSTGDESTVSDATVVSNQDTADTDRAHLRKLMTDPRPALAASVAQAGAADAAKGTAVAQQRQAFDTLLNSRIRLQQGLIAVNTLPALNATTTTAKFGPASTDAAAAAENAAFRLWHTLDSIRAHISNARVGATKRKRPSPAETSPSSAMWQHMRAAEHDAQPHRRAVLSKWSAKTALVTTARAAPRRLDASAVSAAAAPRSLLDALDTQLAGDAPRLLLRTRTPRSCAPVQAAAGLVDVDIYDDADFYGLLLKELLERRGAAASMGAAGVDADVGDAARQFRAAREVKTRKRVDTRASKGRKMRFTVHERLQNFMAPEDRGVWGARQVDDLFGSLLGRAMGFAEEGEAETQREANGMVRDGEENALMLFRG